MNHVFRAALCFWFSISASAQPGARRLFREERGAPTFNRPLRDGKSMIAGRN
jgi:hypothetical protein